MLAAVVRRCRDRVSRARVATFDLRDACTAVGVDPDADRAVIELPLYAMPPGVAMKLRPLFPRSYETETLVGIPIRSMGWLQ